MASTFTLRQLAAAFDNMSTGTLNAWFAPGSRANFGVEPTAAGTARRFTVHDARVFALARRLSKTAIQMDTAAAWARLAAERYDEYGPNHIRELTIRWYDTPAGGYDDVRFNDDVLDAEPAKPGATVTLTINLIAVFDEVARKLAIAVPDLDPAAPPFSTEPAPVAWTPEAAATHRAHAEEALQAQRNVLARRKAAKERQSQKQRRIEKEHA